MAAFYGHNEIVQIMIDFAEKQGLRQKKHLINFLNRRFGISALTYSLINDQPSTAELLVKNQAMVYYDHTNLEKDLSPLFVCVYKQNMGLMEIMYNHNRKNMESTNSQGITALMFAAEHKIQKMVNFLSLRTINLNIEDSKGTTILMHLLF